MISKVRIEGIRNLLPAVFVDAIDRESALVTVRKIRDFLNDVVKLREHADERDQALIDVKSLMSMTDRRRLIRCRTKQCDVPAYLREKVGPICDRYRFFDEPCPHCENPPRWAS